MDAPDKGRLFDLTAKSLLAAERGPLITFALFDEVMLVWLAENSDFESTLEWYGIDAEEFAVREQKLAHTLLEFITCNDTRSLARVVDTMKFLQASFEPVNKLETALMQFFRRHADERWKIGEVQARFKAETGFHMEEKTLRRRCEENGFFYIKRPVRTRK